MIGDILSAIIEECKALLTTSTGAFTGTIILQTNFRSHKLQTYAMPLLLLDMIDGPEMSQWCGGATRCDWVWGMNSYNYEPNAYGDDDSGIESGTENNSEGLLDVIDTIRRHFSSRAWLTMNMPYIENTYGFRFTLSGMHRANALEADGLTMGWRITFDSIAIDAATDKVQPSAAPLASVVQIGYPPA